jgi:hypothetical protein
MIVRPEEISASKAPSTSPLNICDTRLGQLITASLDVDGASGRDGGKHGLAQRSR